jgi:hypothetical protein
VNDNINNDIEKYKNTNYILECIVHSNSISKSNADQTVKIIFAINEIILGNILKNLTLGDDHNLFLQQ